MGTAGYGNSHNQDIWKTKMCLECVYLPICFGGCRQLALLRNGVINEVDCRREYYVALMERVVRQEQECRGSNREG